MYWDERATPCSAPRAAPVKKKKKKKKKGLTHTPLLLSQLHNLYTPIEYHHSPFCQVLRNRDTVTVITHTSTSRLGVWKSHDWATHSATPTSCTLSTTTAKSQQTQTLYRRIDSVGTTTHTVIPAGSLDSSASVLERNISIAFCKRTSSYSFWKQSDTLPCPRKQDQMGRTGRYGSITQSPIWPF